MNDSFLREAIRLALENVERGGGPFGAVIVRAGEIIGRGQNLVISTNDPTAHAEVVAIRNACASLQSFSLEGCELYSSCEPCPLCLAATYWSRLDRIYYGASCEDAKAAGFRDRYLYEELRKPAGDRSMGMTQGLRDEARAAFEAWVKKENRVRY